MADRGCEETIQASWNQHQNGTAMLKVSKKLKNCKKQLGAWSRQSFGSIKRQLEEKKRQLCEAEARAISGGDLGEIKVRKEGVKGLLRKENEM